MYTQLRTSHARECAAEQALKALSGLGISLLTNQDWCWDHRPDGPEPRECRCNAFWWTSEDFTERYEQENAKAGDTFYDGNNGDKHQVVAVDLENNRLAFRNLDQNPDLIDIACW